MSAIVPKEKMLALIEVLFNAGYEVEMFNISKYDDFFIVIKLQISIVQKNNTLIKLAEALSSLDYEIEALKPISESYFDGLEVLISQNYDVSFQKKLRLCLAKTTENF